MDTNIYIGLSHQVAIRRQMDITANNIANMNTTAFKRESVMFREYLDDMKGDLPRSLRSVAFVQDYGVAREMSDGDYETTGNPFDIAISGKALLKVRRDNGGIAYTRNGHLSLGEDGTLVLSTGQPVLDAEDNPIQLPSPANSNDIKFAGDGTVWSKENGVIGKLALVAFADSGRLTKIGDNLFTTEQPPQEDPESKILQGVTEGSNVQPIMEITNMINISRAYIQTAKMMDEVQKAQSQAINRLTRFG